MSGRDQSLNAKERALRARELRYSRLTYREIGKELFGVSRERAFQLVAIGTKIEEKQAEVASKRIRQERSHDLAIEIGRLICKGVDPEQISNRLGISVHVVMRLAADQRRIVSLRAAHGIL